MCARNMASSNEKRIPSARGIDRAEALQARDYKGLKNFDANIVLEVNSMEDGTCRTIKSQYYKNSISNFERDGTFGASAAVQIKQATKEGYIPMELPGVANLSYPDSNTRRGRVVQGGADMSDSDNGEYP